MEKTAHGNNIRILREANRYLIIQCIMKLAPIAIEEIVQNTGLSRPTVLNIVHELEEEDILVRDGYSVGSVGRSASLLNLNPARPVALGIDFEFPVIRMCLANLKGEILASDRLVCDQNSSKNQVIDQFYAKVAQFVTNSNISTGTICGAGIGICGTIDSEKGISLHIERIRDWHNVNIQEDLENLLQIPVYVRNDVHLLGLVEKRCYLPESMQNFIYVAIRTGIGSITYQNGKPMRGLRGNAGFIGHTVVNPFGPRCCCGSHGCLETYAGQHAIVNQYLTLSRELIPFDEIVRRGNEGEPNAVNVLKDAGQAFGVAVTNLSKTFEITDVIVGSPSIRDNDPFMSSACEAIQTYSAGMDLDISLQMGQVNEDQYPLGGCYLVFDHLFSKPKLALSPI